MVTNVDLDWRFALTVAVILMVVVVPFFVRSIRLHWAAMLSVLCMVGVVWLWIRDFRASDGAELSIPSDSATAEIDNNFFVTSRLGSFRLTYIKCITPPPPLGDKNETLLQFSHSSEHLSYQQERSQRSHVTTAWNVLGVGLLLSEDPSVNPIPAHYIRAWELFLPNWALILCTCIFPGRWFYMRLWGRKAYSRRHNLCVECGYCLNGLTAPVRCPECGTLGRGTGNSELSFVKDHSSSP